LEDRLEREITFPRLAGYRYDLPEAKLEVTFASSLSDLTRSFYPRLSRNPLLGPIPQG